MHEMSIALSIVDLASEKANQAKATQVIELELDIGSLSGVEIEALRFAMEVATKNTVLESTRVKINRIPASAECLECGQVFESERFAAGCPACGEWNVRILKGKELQLKSLLIE